MARSLVIVESPSKARTINKYLGKEYVVKSSVGHVRDLPTSGRKTVDPKARAKEAAKTRKLSPKQKETYKKKRARKQLVRRMGIDPDAGWKATYEILPGKEKVIAELRKVAETSDAVFLATDLDREGEAIAWHLKEILGGDSGRYRRVVFNEITEKAIKEAFEEPGEIDQNMVDAQQARRFLDRVVGFEVSPLLWNRVARGLSAGRVQSVAVRLLVDREREIRAFDPEEYWEAYCHLKAKDAFENYRFQVVKEKGLNFRPSNSEQSDQAISTLKKSSFQVLSKDERPTSSRPSAPFITSTLQQSASTRLGFSVRKTMTLAQRLYEAGLITYMRTDSTNLSADAISAARSHLEQEFGAQYVPEKPNVYAVKADAQEAHEAVRPTSVDVTENEITGQEPDALRLYDLIRRQFLACQMVPAKYLSTTYTVGASEFELRIRGRIIQFEGYTKVLPPTSRKEDEVTLPALKVDENLELVEANAFQHFTKPPARYGEASLVRELEKRGIGRPSTYASIISTIQDRGYVSLRNRRFYAEKIGELVTDRLIENFDDLMDYSFTAEMENGLDKVASGNRDWKQMLGDFYGDFSENLVKANEPESGMRANSPTSTDIVCDKDQCGRMMQLRTASTGVFLGCSGYNLPPKERCKHTKNLISGDEAVDIDQDEDGESKLLRIKRRCPKCNTVMDSYLIDETRKIHVCGNNPDCDGFEIEKGEFKIKGYDGPILECDKCGEDMELKSGRFGKYFGCSNADCKNTRKLLRNGEAAPPKADPVPMPELKCKTVEDHYVLRDGAAGIFLAASGFPRNRETRAPLVGELKVHANELDPKFRYLLEAPEFDPDGIPTVIKFARKVREQYVTSEQDGKSTGWSAHYENNKWTSRISQKKTRKKRTRS